MNDRGNILFLILLAVVLFAALSYAVTSSMRGGGKDVSDEKSQSLATGIFNYATLMDSTVQRLLLRGCKDTQLNFYSPGVPYSSYTNSNAPADKSCNVYDAAGGGMNTKVWGEAELDESQSAAANYGESHVTGSSCVTNIGTAGSTCYSTGDASLIFLIRYVDEKVCRALNKMIFGYAEIPVESNTLGISRFSGTYGTGTKPRIDWGATANIKGTAQNFSPNGCVQISSTGEYIYWQVILPR